MTYSKPEHPAPHSFLALRVTPHELKELFRIGPLHPFIQMLADGELFHAHTKIASTTADEQQRKPLHGYFMECNKHCNDPIGYIVTYKMTAQELETAFRTLCERSGSFVRAESERESSIQEMIPF